MEVGSCGSSKSKAEVVQSDMCSFINLSHFIQMNAKVFTPSF